MTKLNFFQKTILLSVAVSLFSCGNRQTEKENCTVVPVEWSRNAIMYEVNTRQFTPEGTFEAFMAHLPRLQKLGVDILWFMPIHPICETNRKGTLGSYYAISDYKGINPEFGTHEDFRRLVNKAHEMGFKVILDWVANHTGFDHHWLTEHPEWYDRDENGDLISPYDWSDVVQLDFSNQDLRAAMLDAMKFWVREFNVDGFRADVAYMVPTDFWNHARQELQKIRPIFMLAEAERPELLEHAFDMDYNWKLMHLMAEVADGERNANDIYALIRKQEARYCPDTYRMNFLTNHDENSWSGTEFERYGDGVSAFAVLTYILPGMPLIYTGQETGMKIRLEFFEKDEVPCWEINEYFYFYQTLNHLKRNHPALLAGQAGGDLVRINTTDNENVLILSRTKGNGQVIAFLNLSDNAVEYQFTDEVRTNTFTELFSNEIYTEFPTALQAWEYKVLVR